MIEKLRISTRQGKSTYRVISCMHFGQRLCSLVHKSRTVLACLLEVYRTNWNSARARMYVCGCVSDALKTCIAETDRWNRGQVATFTETRVPVPWILNFAVASSFFEYIYMHIYMCIDTHLYMYTIYCGSLQVSDYEFRFEYGNVPINQSECFTVRKLQLLNSDVDNCISTVTLLRAKYTLHTFR